MKRLTPTNESTRFRGGVRHHHRVSPPPQSSWDQWVAGERAERPQRNWPLILWLLLGMLAVIAVVLAIFFDLW